MCIRDSIRIGRKDATDEEVIAAARLANCEEFAEKLPDGYNSMIGENGCELSGGERDVYKRQLLNSSKQNARCCGLAE